MSANDEQDVTSWEDLSPAGDRTILKKRITEGEGDRRPVNGDNVKVLYVGTLVKNGYEFDSTTALGEPVAFVLSERSMIKGFAVGLLSMTKGEVSRIRIDSQYGYGVSGNAPDIPPNADLEFEITLVDFGKDEAQAAAAKATLSDMERLRQVREERERAAAERKAKEAEKQAAKEAAKKKDAGAGNNRGGKKGARGRGK